MSREAHEGPLGRGISWEEQGRYSRSYGRHRVEARHFIDEATALVNRYFQQDCGVMGGQVVLASRWQGRGGLGAWG